MFICDGQCWNANVSAEWEDSRTPLLVRVGVALRRTCPRCCRPLRSRPSPAPSHGNTDRRCCSLSPSLPAPAKPIWRSG